MVAYIRPWSGLMICCFNCASVSHHIIFQLDLALILSLSSYVLASVAITLELHRYHSPLLDKGFPVSTMPMSSCSEASPSSILISLIEIAAITRLKCWSQKGFDL
jgi:hypothetical protein